MPLRSRSLGRRISNASSNQDNEEEQIVDQNETVSSPLFDLDTNLNDNEDQDSFYKDYALNSKLGNHLLNQTATLLAICKKMNLPEKKMLSMDETAKLFYQYDTEKDSKNALCVEDIVAKVENNLVNNEFSCFDMSQPVKPPTRFSPIPVLTTPEKYKTALSNFPTRSSQKFCDKGSMNIIEFLLEMNSGQRVANLSEQEFIDFLLKCTTGNVYTILLDYVSFNHSLDEIYSYLLGTYDNRMDIETAQDLLHNLRAEKHQKLINLQSRILSLSSRASARAPPHQSKTDFFNMNACSALIRALPTESARLVTEISGALSNKLKRLLTFNELTRALKKFTSIIDQDIRNNGAHVPFKNRTVFGKNKVSRAPTFTPRFRSMNRRVNVVSYGGNSIGFNPNPRNDNHFRRNDGQDRQYRSNGYERQSRTDRPDRQMQNTKLSHNPRRKENDRKNVRNLTFKNKEHLGKDTLPSLSRKKKYCSLCGDNSGTHSSSDICFKMRSRDGRIQDVIPTFLPCQTCQKVEGKDLFHPSAFCFNKDALKQQNAPKKGHAKQKD